MRVRAYVDFDGVLNSFNYNPQLLVKKTKFDDWSLTDKYIYSIMVSRERNEMMNEFAELVDFVWLTTWHQHPFAVEDTTGITERPFYDRTFSTTEHWTDRTKQGSRLAWMSWKADVVFPIKNLMTSLFG